MKSGLYLKSLNCCTAASAAWETSEAAGARDAAESPKSPAAGEAAEAAGAPDAGESLSRPEKS